MRLAWCQLSADEGEGGRTALAGDKSRGAPRVSQLPFRSTPLAACPRWLVKGQGCSQGVTPGSGPAADLGSSPVPTLDVAQGEGAAQALPRVTRLRTDRSGLGTGARFEHACVPDGSG